MTQISRSQANDIRLIVGIPETSINKLIEGLSAESNILSREALDRTFAKYVGVDHAEALLKFTSSIAVQSDSAGEKLDDILESLQETLTYSDFSAEEIDSYKTLRPRIKDLAKNVAFYCSVKSGYLSAISDRHIHNLKVVVGARPMFDEERNEIFSTVVHANVTLLTSDAAEQERHLTFKVGKQQLQRIKTECERAIRKIEALERALARGVGMTVFVEGGEE